MRKWIGRILVVVGLLPVVSVVTWYGVSLTVWADVSGAQREEVDHLLQFIRTTGCMIERNGKDHTGEEAYSHVKQKYDYFRDKIRTTEDFVEYSATKSALSSRFYRVKCGGNPPMRTRDWLLEELAKYRNQRNKAKH